MYAGHFAAGLALKAREREAPLWGILIGVGLLDLLFGPFVLAGIEQVTLTPGVAPGFALDHIDWSHSLAMSIVWSALFGLLFWSRGRRIAVVMGVAAFSHFLLDLPMHPPDLAIWPGSDVHLGLGLWQRLPTGWWFVELVFILVAGAYYLRASQSRRQARWQPLSVIGVVLLLHVANSPWLSAV